MNRVVVLPLALALADCETSISAPKRPPETERSLPSSTTSTPAKAAKRPTETATKPVVSPRRFLSVDILVSLEADLHRALQARSSELADQGPALAQVVKRVLIWWLDVRRHLRKGDQLDLVWEPVAEEEPRLWAVWFKSQKLKKTKLALHFKPEGSRFYRWIDPSDGTEVALRLEQSPVREYEQITSLLNDGRRHRGVDFKAPEGTLVFAPFSGKVGRVNWSRRTNGRCIELFRNGSSWRALFLHLSSVSVRPGQSIERGQVLGRVGNTGRSFAPHLHYQLESGRRVLDPFRVQESYRARLSDSDLASARRAFHDLSALRGSAP